jgi:acetylglutamate synthase
MDDLRRNCGELATISAVLYDVSFDSNNQVPEIQFLKDVGLLSTSLVLFSHCQCQVSSTNSTEEKGSCEKGPWRGGTAYSNVSMVGC